MFAKFPSFLVALFFLSTLTLSSPLPKRNTIQCYAGVFVIGARATDDLAGPGFGGTKPVVDDVLARIPNSGAVFLDYPASYIYPLYSDSVYEGIETLILLVTDYVNSCPGGKIVLVGYSQGGNVITDALAGGVLKPAPLDPRYVEHISAVTVFGDPTFVLNQSFNAGNNTKKDGRFPRSDLVREGDRPGSAGSLTLLNTYADKIQSYCDDLDFFCASGPNYYNGVHGREIPAHKDAAVGFIVAKST